MLFPEIYVYNPDLEFIGIIDGYESLIWTNRYNDVGECEVYMPCTTKALTLLAHGNYIKRQDDDMFCVIRKIEIKTDVDEGDHLAVYGYDTKILIDQRVVPINSTLEDDIWDVETLISNRVYSTLISPSVQTGDVESRKMKKTDGTPLVNFPNTHSFTSKKIPGGEYAPANLGEETRELCGLFSMGYRAVLSDGKITMSLVEGTDRSATVFFSEQYDNLLETDYTEDDTGLQNVAYVKFDDKTNKWWSSAIKGLKVGLKAGTDRHEIIIESPGVNAYPTLGELRTRWPDCVLQEESTANYRFGGTGLRFLLAHEAEEIAHYRLYYSTGERITENGNVYWYVSGWANVARFSSVETPTDETETQLTSPLIRSAYYDAAYSVMADHQRTTTFTAKVEPSTSYVYKTDYFLGDVVRVVNAYGIGANARITEITEVYDQNGYSFEPTFVYATAGPEPEPEPEQALLTETSVPILTEAGNPVLLESSPSLATTASTNTDGSKISELPVLTALGDSDIFAAVNSETTKKVAYSTIKSQLATDLGITAIPDSVINALN